MFGWLVHSIIQKMRRSSGEFDPAQLDVQSSRELACLNVNVVLKADLSMLNLSDGL